jgi:thioredoxin-related protein
MNTFYFFVSSNYSSQPILKVYDILREQDKDISTIVNLVTCNQRQRDIANHYNVQNTPCLFILNQRGEVLESLYGSPNIVQKLNFLYSKYGK